MPESMRRGGSHGLCLASLSSHYAVKEFRCSKENSAFKASAHVSEEIIQCLLSGANEAD